MRDFSRRLRSLRRAKRFKMKDLAEQIGVPLSTYREWEYGRSIVGEPYPRIAAVLGVSLHELMTGEAPSKREVFQEVALLEMHLRALKTHLQSFL